jgi:cytidine deaminase
MSHQLDEQQLQALEQNAWTARNNARIHGRTKVGCAVLDEHDQVFVGCNVEHLFRSHDIHAEVNAISSLVAAGSKKVVAVYIAAERSRFTPCGSCLDWIFELGGSQCLVYSQSHRGEKARNYQAQDLMPYYPLP